MLTVDELVKTFRAAQRREAEFGASDTEPDWVWQDYVAKAMGLREGAPHLPQDAEEWEIYTDLDGSDAAARRLSQALVELTGGLKGLLAEDPPSVLQALREKLWRLDL